MVANRNVGRLRVPSDRDARCSLPHSHRNFIHVQFSYESRFEIAQEESFLKKTFFLFYNIIDDNILDDTVVDLSIETGKKGTFLNDLRISNFPSLLIEERWKNLNRRSAKKIHLV